MCVYIYIYIHILQLYMQVHSSKVAPEEELTEDAEGQAEAADETDTDKRVLVTMSSMLNPVSMFRLGWLPCRQTDRQRMHRRIHG